MKLLEKILFILNIAITFLIGLVLFAASIAIISFALFGGSYELTINNPFF